MVTLSGRECTTGEVITVTVEAGRIASIETCDPVVLAHDTDLWLAPGFFDIQINGYGGTDFNQGIWSTHDDDAPAFPRLFEQIARSGTALFCPTFITNSTEAICAGMASLSRFLNDERQYARAVPCFHLEGPYISAEDGPRGAHPLQHVRDPNWEEFERFQDAAEGRIRLCTLAPERSGAFRFIEKLVEAGVVVALGHTAAEPETIRDAVQAGARLSTHLGNGAHSRIQRHPNYIWEQLADDRLFASLIADGHHLPDSVLKVFTRAKSAEKLILVSDAVALGGLPPGRYSEGKYEVLPTGRIVLADTPYLAGAGHLLDTGIAHVLRTTDLTLAQTLCCVTSNPARLLGLEAHKGKLQIGYDADLTLFRIPQSGPLEIVMTLCGGKVVYDKSLPQ